MLPDGGLRSPPSRFCEDGSVRSHLFVLLALSAGVVPATGGQPALQRDTPGGEPRIGALLADLAKRAGTDPAAWLEYAETLHAHGLVEKAVSAYRKVVGLIPAEDPLSFQARYLLAHAIRPRNPREAADALADALRSRPGYPPALILLGEIREELGQPEAAAVAYRQALRLEPDSSLALFRLGSLESGSGNFREAVRLLEHALGREPDAGAVRAALAAAWNAAGERERARDILRSAEPGNTSLPGIGDPIHFRMQERDISSPRLLERARAVRAAGRFAEAEARYRDLVRIRPRDPVVLAEFGAVLHARSRPEEAEPLYRDAVALAPGQPLARLGLGMIRAAAGDLPAAEFQFRTALRQRSEDPRTHAALGDVLLRQRRFEEGLAALDRARVLDPEDGTVQVRRAAALAELGRFDEAWEAVREAREAGEEPPAAFLEALRKRLPEPGAG